MEVMRITRVRLYRTILECEDYFYRSAPIIITGVTYFETERFTVCYTFDKMKMICDRQNKVIVDGFKEH